MMLSYLQKIKGLFNLIPMVVLVLCQTNISMPIMKQLIPIVLQNWAWVSDKYSLLGHYYTQADVRECWDDYVAKGEGGKIANLSGGAVGIKAADGLMRDDLSPSPLHRQWYLEPRIGGFAFGEVAQRHASVVNFSSTKNSNQLLPKFLAYPSPGYFPASFTHRPNYTNIKIDWSF